MQKQEIYFQVARSHLEEQEQRNRELQSKASTVLGFAATLLGLAVIVIKDFSGSGTGGALALSPGAWAFLAGVLLFFFLSVGLSLYANRPREWRRNPELTDFSNYINDPQYADEILVEWAGDQFKNSVAFNEPILDQKAWVISTAQLSLAAQAFTVIGLAVAVRVVG